jgi:hypothetical protein
MAQTNNFRFNAPDPGFWLNSDPDPGLQNPKIFKNSNLKKDIKNFFPQMLYSDFQKQKNFNALGEALKFFREKIQFFFSTDKKQVTER